MTARAIRFLFKLLGPACTAACLVLAADQAACQDASGGDLGGVPRTGVGFIPPSSAASIEVPPAGEGRTVRGRVVHYQSRRPLPGLRVEIVAAVEAAAAEDRPGTHLSAVTGEEGWFAVAGVPWKRYGFRLRADNYRVETFHFEPFGAPQWAVLQAAPAVRMAFRVLGADGRPEPGARLFLVRMLGDKAAVLAPCVSDEAGGFLLYGLEVGARIAAAAQAAEGMPLSRLSLIEPRPGGAEPILLRLEEGRAVSGRVVNQRGTPVAGVRLDCAMVCPPEWDFQSLPIPVFGPAGAPKDGLASDGGGAFTLHGLVPGRYRLTAEPDREMFEANETIFTIGEAGAVAHGEIVLTLTTRPVIMGRVLDESGAPVPRASVFLHAHYRSSYYCRALAADQDGTFVSREFPRNCAVRFMAWSEGFQPCLVERAVSGGDGVTVVLKRGAAVSGRVLSSGGQPLTGFDVTWHSGLDEPFAYDLRRSADSEAVPVFWEPRSIRDESGRFDVTGLPAGFNTLTFEAPGHYRKAVTVRPDSAGDVIEDLRVVLEATHRVEGTVTFEETGEPVPGAIVVPRKLRQDGSGLSFASGLYSREGIRLEGKAWYRGLLAATADGKGAFSLDLPPGTYHLHVGTQNPYRDVWKHGPFEVAPDGACDELALTVQKSRGSVAVRLTDRDGRPLSGVRVACGNPRGVDDGFEGVSTETDGTGTARLAGIRPGERDVKAVIKEGFYSHILIRRVNVLPESETSITLTPPPSELLADITGRVFRDGVPLAGTAVFLNMVHSADMTLAYEGQVASGGDGSFVFPGVPRGDYSLSACHSRSPYLEVRAGTGAIEHDIHVGPCLIEGSLAIEDGELTEGDCRQWVELVSVGWKEGYVFRHGQPDRSGRFLFDFLDEGRYVIVAHAGPIRMYSISDHQQGRACAGIARNVESCRDGDGRPVVVALRRAGSLSLVMPRPEFGCDPVLTFFPEEETSVRIQGADDVSAGGLLKRYRYAALAPGRYAVAFPDARDRGAPFAFDVNPGDVIELEYESGRWTRRSRGR